jgi:hypothetical protein
MNVSSGARSRWTRFALICPLVVAATCGEPLSDVSGPTSSLRSADDPSLDQSRMAALRSNGEGCSVGARDSLGVMHAIAVRREHLPISMPKIHQDGTTGLGNGTITRLTFKRSAASPVILSCWVPDTLTLPQFAAAVFASGNDERWQGILHRLGHAPELPDIGRRKPLSPEARAYAASMLASDSNAVAAARRAPTKKSASSPRATRNVTGCDWNSFAIWYDDIEWDNGFTCLWSNGVWSFEFSLYSIYDYWWYSDYVYITDNSPSCQSAEVQEMMAQYRDASLFTGTFRPTCWDFDSTGRSVRFTHTELTTGMDTRWAILKPSLLADSTTGYGADAWRHEYGSSRISTSGYRSPQHNADITPAGALNSQHMWGDALDLYTESCNSAIPCPDNATTRAEWQSMFDAAGSQAAGTRAHADFREILDSDMGTCPCSGLGHAHADWRNHH